MTTLKSLHSLLSLFCLFLVSCTNNTPERTPAIAASFESAPDDCDDPDADINCCFVGMPSELTSTMTICGPEEPGERLILSGTVYQADGKTPFPGVILYAYHTDNKGIYSKNGTETGVQKWHGHLHGWCKTDQNGHYEIHTIRPASYPKSTAPAHIHSAVKKPDNSRPFYINDFVFRDDPFVSEKNTANLRNPGGSGIVDVLKSAEGVWTGKRDLILP